MTKIVKATKSNYFTEKEGIVIGSLYRLAAEYHRGKEKWYILYEMETSKRIEAPASFFGKVK